jgi:hypothetical protein
MRRFFLLTACLFGAGLFVLYLLGRQRDASLAPEWPADAEWDDPADREPASDPTEFSVAAPPPPAPTSVRPAEPVAQPEPAEEGTPEPAEEEAAPLPLDAVPEPEAAPVEASAAPPEEPAPVGGTGSTSESLSDHLRRELRAELEKLPRQPLFERANACGVPTSRTILMSREELIVAIEEMELRGRVSGSSA